MHPEGESLFFDKVCDSRDAAVTLQSNQTIEGIFGEASNEVKTMGNKATGQTKVFFFVKKCIV